MQYFNNAENNKKRGFSAVLGGSAAAAGKEKQHERGLAVVIHGRNADIKSPQTPQKANTARIQQSVPSTYAAILGSVKSRYGNVKTRDSIASLFKEMYEPDSNFKGATGQATTRAVKTQDRPNDMLRLRKSHNEKGHFRSSIFGEDKRQKSEIHTARLLSPRATEPATQVEDNKVQESMVTPRYFDTSR